MVLHCERQDGSTLYVREQDGSTLLGNKMVLHCM